MTLRTSGLRPSRYWLLAYIISTLSVVVDLEFQWDSGKSRANEKKHGVSFAEAETAFGDEHGLFMADPDHSADEDRFVLIGMSASLRVLIVCHCYRASETIIRIISARTATRVEERQYSQRWKR